MKSNVLDKSIELEHRVFELFEKGPIYPVLFYEYSFRSYVDNVYFKKLHIKEYPRLIVLQEDNYQVWEEKKSRINLEDKKIIKSIISFGRDKIKKYSPIVNKFNNIKAKDLDSKVCIKYFNDFNHIFKDIYQGYIFYCIEYFNTQDKELIKILPEERMLLSTFATEVWNAYDKILSFIENKYKFGKQKSGSCTSEELIGLLNGNLSILDNKNLEKRPIAFVIENNLFNIYVGEKAKEIRNYIYSQNKQTDANQGLKNGEILKGNIANSGFGRGLVIKITEDDYGKYTSIFKDKKDYVLVAPMTRPEIVPFLSNAKAIITNEGGLTCHAAIVSRELKIPCIVGTKKATQVLKDGDMVEVDADKGIIKIIK